MIGPTFALAAGIAAGITLLAWRAQSLSASGAAAAMIVGTIALSAGYPWGAFLIAWFVLASVASRLGRQVKLARTAAVIEKGAKRDASQVVANGAIFCVAAAASLISPDTVPQVALWGSAALSAAGADTFATEIGTWFGGTPRDVRTGRAVAVGSSGAVSIAGTLAMMLSALALASIAASFGLITTGDIWIVATAAILGAIADTLLGALAQQRRWCITCDMATEQRAHMCGRITEQRGGWRWLANDQVNFICTFIGALAAWALGKFAASVPQ